MHQASKLVLRDSEGKFLLLRRGDHPIFGRDPDLPGGTIEDGESPLTTMVREVYEEIGVNIQASQVQLVYQGDDYSNHGARYTLYAATLNTRPTIVMSWEHESYDWLELKQFLVLAEGANDSYMHMVHDVMKQL